jgi:Uma2 family endonuclease
MIQHRPTQPARADLPTMYDLPSEDPEEMGLPDEFHDFQPKLLRETCRPPIEEDFFIGADLNLYYDTDHTSWYKRPDWFLVLGAPATQSGDDLRWSYVLWQEGAVPFLVVELLSPGTEAEDLGQTLRVVGKPPTKWQVYEQELQVPYYVLFDRSNSDFRLFQLTNNRYLEREIGPQGFWFPELQLSLRKWSGQYFGVDTMWLRWFDRFQQKIPTGYEQAEQEAQRAEQEAQRAEQESQRAEQESQRAEQESQRAEQESQRADLADQRAERLAAQLRSLGIEPD